MSTLQDIAAMKACGKHTWREISDYTGVRKNTCKSRYTRKGRHLQPGPCPVCSSAQEQYGVEVKEENNTLEAVATDDRIKTVEQLKVAIQLDETEWVVIDSGYRKWDGFAKDKTGSLHWLEGKIDHGNLYYNGVSVTELFSVWIKCARREPVLLNPSIKSVNVNISQRAYIGGSDSGAQASLVTGDLHVGFEREIETGRLVPMHDREFMACTIKVVEEVQPEEFHLIGDGLDLAGFSSFTKLPQHSYTFQPALMELAWYLGRIRAAMPRGSKVYYHEGNHEARIDKDLAKAMPELYGIKAVNADIPALSLESLLDLKSIGVEWVGGYPDSFREYSGIVLKHGNVVKQPGLTARHYADNEIVSTVTAHIHREEVATRVVYGPGGKRVIKAYTIGCGCDTQGVVPAKKKNNNWTKGFALIYRGQWPQVNLITVDEGSFVMNGRSYVCDSYVDQLEEQISDVRWR